MGIIARAPETFRIHDNGFKWLHSYLGCYWDLNRIKDRFNFGLHHDQQSLDLILQYVFVPCYKRKVGRRRVCIMARNV